MTGGFPIAVHALVCLCHRGDMLSSDTLAENICTHPAQVRRVMSALGKAGLVSTREGTGGGYRLSMDASAITLLQVADALQQQLIVPARHSPHMDRDCFVASGMAAVMDTLYGELDACCRRELAAVSIADIHQRLRREKG